MNIGYKSDAGKVRQNNEDCFIVDKEIGLFIVADGVGGHQGGEVASKLGALTIQQVIRERLAVQDKPEREAIIKEAIDQAHRAVSEKAADNHHLCGMGTTVVLGWFHYRRVYIAHVGDSRAYLINAKNITPLTEDHSVVAALLKAGKITPQEAKTHKMRHVITQCLGIDEYAGPAIKSFPIKRGDILLLCSDGLTDMVEDHEIKKEVQEKRKNLQSSANELIKLANKKGGRDNITLILIALVNQKKS